MDIDKLRNIEYGLKIAERLKEKFIGRQSNRFEI